MELFFSIDNKHRIESANYVTNVNPTLHPDRVMELHDFLYILEGTWEIYEEETLYRLSSDDLLILSAGKHHFGKTPSSAGNKHMYIHLYAESSDDALKQRFFSLYHCASNPKVKQYFKEIIAAYWSDSLHKESRISMLFGLLLCELSSIGESDGKNPRHSKLLTDVTEMLQTHPHTIYSCEEMAAKFYICPRTLSNVFVKTHGVSFYSYQMNMKLEMVRQYLSDHPNELLYNVAKNFGLYDEFHLSKTFKKKYGISPRQFLKG